MFKPSSSRRTKTNSWRVIVAGGGVLWILNAIWLAIDTRPPVWDMALHQVYALHYLSGYALPPDLKFWQLSGNYPPLVHLFIAFLFRLFHPSPDVAAFVNLPATFLLLWSVFELGQYFSSASTARWTCLLVLLTPYLIWMSRETILDYWLTAWVVTAWMLLVKTDGFTSRSASRYLGVVSGFGLLTKWLFLGFMAAPVLWIAVRHRVWKNAKSIRNIAEASLIAGLIAAVWYVPNLTQLFHYFSENAQIGALEGEPTVLSFQSFIYYLRLLEGYQLYAVLFVLTIAGAGVALKKRLLHDPFLWIAMIVGGWLVATLLRTKDPRFTMPLLPALLIAPAAMIASWMQRRWGRVAATAIVAVLAAQAYIVNFGVSWLPQQVVLMRGYQGSLRWDWQLYSQHYFWILGAPRRENWRQSEIIARVSDEARTRGARPSLTLVPDLPRFDTSNFLLFATLDRVSLKINHARSVAEIGEFDFVVVTEKEQGMSWTTPESLTLTEMVRSNPTVFKLVTTYDLPNEDVASLYFIDRSAAAK